MATVASDPQVIEVNSIQEPKTLLDEVVDQFYAEGRDGVYPIMSRIAIVGDIAPGSGTDSFVGVMKDLIKEGEDSAWKKRGGSVASLAERPINLSGVTINYGDRFVQLVDFPPDLMAEYMHVLYRKGASKPSKLQNVYVAFLIDDIGPRLSEKMFFVEGTRANAAAISAAEAPEKEDLFQNTLKAIRTLEKLVAFLAQQPASKEQYQAAACKSSNPSFFPPEPWIVACQKSDLCLTLQEYFDLFVTIPNVTRSIEIRHPIGEPLNYLPEEIR